MEEQKIYKLTDQERKDLQNCLLEMYKDVAEVCKKYDLDLMMGGGTCLGAVRHKGFIPWDDDLDLNMPRKDYNKLLDVFNIELGEDYHLVEIRKTGTGQRLFGKIMKRNTTYIETGTIINDTPTGVFVDIFPIESLPNNYFLRSCFMFCADIFTRSMSLIIDYQLNPKSNISKINKVLGKATSFISYRKWYSMYDKFISSSNGSKYCTIPSGRKGVYGEMQPLDIFLPLSKGFFEGVEVKLPNNYDEYLKSLYGDYMKLPPIEQRETLHFLKELNINK